jgi:Family of unknown function (DUF6194)
VRFEAFPGHIGDVFEESLTGLFNETLEGVNADQVKQYISGLFDGVREPEHQGDTFFIYDPHGDLPPARQMPFVTIVTGDHYDSQSKLDDPGSYRLNIGLTKATYTERFGGIGEVDHAERDRLMPHPEYAGQYWVCVVNPSDVEALRPLLTEAYEFAVRKHDNYQARHQDHSGQ